MLKLVMLTSLAVTSAFATTSAFAQVLAFAPGGASIDDNADAAHELVTWVQGLPESDVFEVQGYYCSDDVLPQSNDDDLLALAEHRATRVKDLLVGSGIDADRLATVAYGSVAGGSGCQAAVVPASGRFQGPIIGIGVVIGPTDGGVAVMQVVDGAPASADGTLQPGDRIIAVQSTEDAEWRSLAGMRLERAVGLIRGLEGSVVGLRYQCADDGATRELFLTREVLKLTP